MELNLKLLEKKNLFSKKLKKNLKIVRKKKHH